MRPSVPLAPPISRLRALVLALVLAMLCAAPAVAAPASAEEELIQLERDYARALINKDMAFLKNYYAPDWRGGDWMGFGSKSTILNLLRDKRYVIRSMTLRDMRVRILGNIAIVQGADEEISSMHGKDTSGIWGFTDIFARRNGRWVAIASQTTKIDRKRN